MTRRSCARSIIGCCPLQVARAVFVSAVTDHNHNRTISAIRNTPKRFLKMFGCSSLTDTWSTPRHPGSRTEARLDHYSRLRCVAMLCECTVDTRASRGRRWIVSRQLGRSCGELKRCSSGPLKIRPHGPEITRKWHDIVVGMVENGASGSSGPFDSVQCGGSRTVYAELLASSLANTAVYPAFTALCRALERRRPL